MPCVSFTFKSRGCNFKINIITKQTDTTQLSLQLGSNQFIKAEVVTGNRSGDINWNIAATKENL